MLARVKDSGKDGMADGNMESLLDLYRHKEHILRVLSLGLMEILVEAEGARVC